MSAKGYLIALAAVITCAALWFGRPQAGNSIDNRLPTESGRELQPKSVAPPAAPVAGAQAVPRHIKAPYFTNEEREKLLSDFKSQHSNRLREIYSDFWPAINAPPETQTAAIEILANREMQLFARSIAPENGVAATPPAPAEIAELHAATQQKLRDLLGEEQATALASYQRTIPERRMVKQFNRLAGKALSAEVQEQLLSIAIEEASKITPPNPSGSREEISTHLHNQSLQKQQAILARASSLLNESDLALLRQAMKSDDRAAARLSK